MSPLKLCSRKEVFEADCTAGEFSNVVYVVTYCVVVYSQGSASEETETSHWGGRGVDQKQNGVIQRYKVLRKPVWNDPACDLDAF